MTLSRIGKMPVSLPDKVTATLDDATITVQGPKGKLAHRFVRVGEVSIAEGVITIAAEDHTSKAKAYHGLARALVQNMVVGVSEGFKRSLEIHGVGYRADVKGKTLEMSLGFSHPVKYPLPEGITVTVDKQNNIEIEGIDKQLVGQVAAEIRGFRPPEPYKGKGIRYSDERIRRKVGKAGV